MNIVANGYRTLLTKDKCCFEDITIKLPTVEKEDGTTDTDKNAIQTAILDSMMNRTIVEYKDYQTKNVSSHALSFEDKIQKIEFGPQVTQIRGSAFVNCYNLKTFIIRSTLTNANGIPIPCEMKNTTRLFSDGKAPYIYVPQNWLYVYRNNTYVDKNGDTQEKWQRYAESIFPIVTELPTPPSVTVSDGTKNGKTTISIARCWNNNTQTPYSWTEETGWTESKSEIFTPLVDYTLGQQLIVENDTSPGKRFVKDYSLYVDYTATQASNIPDDCDLIKYLNGSIQTLKNTTLKTLDSYGLGYRKNLERADFSRLEKIYGKPFWDCLNLKALILRSPEPIQLEDSAAFAVNNTHKNYKDINDKTSYMFQGIGSAGFIYVPPDLLTKYNELTNWTDYKNYIYPFVNSVEEMNNLEISPLLKTGSYCTDDEGNFEVDEKGDKIPKTEFGMCWVDNPPEGNTNVYVYLPLELKNDIETWGWENSSNLNFEIIVSKIQNNNETYYAPIGYEWTVKQQEATE